MSSKKKKKEEASVPVEPVEPDETVEQQPEETEQVEPTLQEQFNELKERYQRLGADYANYQKRSQRQLEQAAKFSQETVARSLLSVLDNFDHTLQQGSEDMNPAAILQGVQIVYDHLVNALGTFGMKRVNVEVGGDFDPSIHEAMLHEENAELEPNKVIRELAAGYIMNERTLRPAKVSVAKAPAPVESEPEAPADENTDDPAQTDDAAKSE